MHPLSPSPPPSAKSISSNDPQALLTQAHNNGEWVFPQILYRILNEADDAGFATTTIGWNDRGTSFRIHNRSLLLLDVLPRYGLRQSHFKSFVRQLNLWGFQCIHGGKNNIEKGSYHHEFFIRGRPELLSKITRIRVKGKNTRRPSSSSSENNNDPSSSMMTAMPHSNVAAVALAWPQQQQQSLQQAIDERAKLLQMVQQLQQAVASQQQQQQQSSDGDIHDTTTLPLPRRLSSFFAPSLAISSSSTTSTTSSSATNMAGNPTQDVSMTTTTNPALALMKQVQKSNFGIAEMWQQWEQLDSHQQESSSTSMNVGWQDPRPLPPPPVEAPPTPLDHIVHSLQRKNSLFSETDEETMDKNMLLPISLETMLQDHEWAEGDAADFAMMAESFLKD